MMSSHSLVLLIVAGCGTIVFAAGNPSADTGAEQESVQPAAIAQVTRPEARSVIRGTVTWVDADRRLVVLQDGSDVRALRVDLPTLDLKVGEWVALEGRAAPLITAFPDYPDQPAGLPPTDPSVSLR
jgi:hypothetical protein